MKMIFLGAPGVGKGTQATRVCEKYAIPHISTGDILRANIKAGTPLGNEAKSIIDKGLLVPDEVVIGLVKDRLAQADCSNGYVLDGFPRTIQQAEQLGKFASIDLVVNIVLDEATIIQRIAGRRMCTCGESYHISLHPADTCDKCGEKLYQRVDDKEETVMARLEVYNNLTAPLIDYYNNMGILVDVDGSTGMECVCANIVRIIDDNN